MEIAPILMVIAGSVLGGYLMGKGSEKSAYDMADKYRKDAHEIMNYCFDEYNNLIKIAKQTTYNIVDQYTAKTKKAHAFKDIDSLFVELNVSELVEGLEKKLDIQIVNTDKK